jgi:hypothetical protein
MIGKLIRVVWHDAHGLGDSWMPIDDIDAGPRVIESVGWAVPGIKPGHLVLVNSVDDDHVDGGLAIPIGMVKEIVHLVDGARLPIEC